MSVVEFVRALKKRLHPSTFSKTARMAKEGRMGFGLRAEDVWDKQGRG